MKKLSFDILSLNQIYTILQNPDEPADEEKRDQFKKSLFKIMEELLTQNQRQVILFYYFEQLNTVEIARRLDKNKSTICRTRKAAIKKLARYLNCIT